MEVVKPKIIIDGNYKDFGYGFYCTNLEKQAIRWAFVKRGKHIVTIYKYDENHSLNILRFNQMNDEWLNFIVACRGEKKHNYDIVEGPMADDTTWNYVEDFVSGDISRKDFWELVTCKHPARQIVFCTDQALKQLQFERSYTL